MTTITSSGSFGNYDSHQSDSAAAQLRADKWMISGTILMGTAVLGIFGLPMFLWGLHLQIQAAKAGLSVRPVIVTLIGYLVIIDSALNSMGWTLDLFAHHTLINRVLTTGWGALVDGGYFWHYNELWIGGSGAPGEKAWEIALIPVLFCARLAAAIGLLQMKRWGQQWLIVTCWMGVIVWTGYNTNMTIFADVRYAGVVFPVWGWWIYDIWYITPFLSLPYLHTVNREIFSE
ncbi:hypothetical protein D0B54_15880 [Solimonas sp. K1W22B-7]|uniref:hypothetical protein n=1 Tax=Solimonas sp. K1W22B-7 TaxID=2303331 RepID=UPI000E3351F8|nr:hypothetical protein [Solimonas sp. K1W22B-7]AXQ30058.1 hypothetical protein D0B54_15880 [Solimonas sp. K1W22B-7]